MKGVKNLMNIQKNLQKAMDDFKKTEVVGESGAGMVKITLNGEYAVKKVEIDNNLLGEDKEIIEDLISAAFNSATKKLEDERSDKMSGIVGNLPPGLF